MKEQLQSLIAAGRTEEALVLLATTGSNDAILQQSRYNNGKKNYNIGTIDFGEWSRLQNQVSHALLELANSLPGGSGPAPANPVPPQNSGNPAAPAKPSKKKVFISYNHNDTFPMRAVKGFLEDNDIEAFVDFQDMGIGDKIEDFIDKALKDTQIILSIISENSLKSGWVNRELSSTLLLTKFDKKWLPVLLDKKCFDAAFYNETMDGFDDKIEGINKEMVKALTKKRGVSAFNDELERLRDLQNDFDRTIQALKGHLVEDISGPLFDHGMGRVVKAIQKVGA